MSRTILGTTTAGDTAASTAPMTAASMRVTPSREGASRKNASISQLAGTHDIIIAGLPTFFRSDRSSDSPALSRIMISAICRRSEDTESIDGSSRSSTYGPSTIPVISIPIIPGSFSRLHTAAISSPARKIKASDVNILLLLKNKKADSFCVISQKSSANKRFWFTKGALHSLC